MTSHGVKTMGGSLLPENGQILYTFIRNDEHTFYMVLVRCRYSTGVTACVLRKTWEK